MTSPFTTFTDKCYKLTETGSQELLVSPIHHCILIHCAKIQVHLILYTRLVQFVDAKPPNWPDRQNMYSDSFTISFSCYIHVYVFECHLAGISLFLYIREFLFITYI